MNLWTCVLVVALPLVCAENDAGPLWSVQWDDPKLFIWPKPSSLSNGDKTLGVDPTKFKFEAAGDGAKSELLQWNLKRYYDLTFFSSRKAHNPDNLDTLAGCTVTVDSPDESIELGTNEDYTLSVSASSCEIKAPTVLAAMRGLETFSNLVDWTKEKGYFIRGAPWDIQDGPKFQWRGFLMDTARRYLPKPLIKKIIDALSYNKMNVLHWHITDAESFPYLSKKWPDLAKGAFSPKAVYTAEDMKEIVEYARLRGVRVSPELDTPAHTGSWGIGMPELVVNCQDDDGTITGASLNPIKDKVFEVIDDLLGEFAEIFPGETVHLGSDELLMKCWHQDQEITQAANRISQEKGVDGYLHLYCNFVDRVSKLAAKHGKRTIMWDDVVQKAQSMGCGITLDNNQNLFQIWHSDMKHQVASGGYKMIISDEHETYLNNGWERQQGWVRWDTVYGHYPANNLPENQVLGGELAMWGESTDSSNYLPHCIVRLSTGAEKYWSRNGDLGHDEARFRVLRHRCRLYRRGINARALDFDNGDWRRGRWYQCEVYMMDVNEARAEWDSEAAAAELEAAAPAPPMQMGGTSKEALEKAEQIAAAALDAKAALETEVRELRAQLESLDVVPAAAPAKISDEENLRAAAETRRFVEERAGHISAKLDTVMKHEAVMSTQQFHDPSTILFLNGIFLIFAFLFYKAWRARSNRR